MGVFKGVVVGGTSLDVVDGDVRVGGSAYYSSKALEILGVPLIVVSNSSLLKNYLPPDSSLTPKAGGTPIVYALSYSGGSRNLQLLRSSRIEVPENLHELLKGFRYFLVISPIAGEVGSEALRKLIRVAENAEAVGVDLQGFVRVPGEGGKVLRDPARALPLMRLLGLQESPTIFKGERGEVPEADACWLFGGDGGKYLVITDRSRPVEVVSCGMKCSFNPLPGIEGDETGAGDVFLSVATYGFSLGEDVRTTLAEAAVAAGMKVMRPRPPWFTWSEVLVLRDKVAASWRCY